MCRHVKMSGRAMPATQNDITTCFETFSIFAASAIDTATAPESQRLETRHAVASKRTFRVRLRQIFTLRAPKSTFSHEFCYGPTSKGRFVQGFHHFSSHITKCHACHGICTLLPLRAALTMRFAKNTQHDTSQVLRLPRKVTMEVVKVLRLPLKTIFDT